MSVIDIPNIFEVSTIYFQKVYSKTFQHPIDKVKKDKEDKEGARLSGPAGNFLPTMMEAH